ncbi:MAG: HAD-IA family hydrolase [Fulvimarina manganoxydans]|uniref:HAD-IA family hydrolase n=1 Tax=Fulvimarina manganoxydans TaxID=937218 RepID=UPI0023571FF5|nr:HAD-IA family hydrolase [Fulvimarina manganoxydans]MCK5931608.1 HAD-IA family hydrolase [Fulvimarina manganoxydans]
MAPSKVVVFDIIETVFSLEPVRHGLASAGFDPSDLETWFAFGLRDAFALNATGDFVPFKEVLDGALEQLAATRGLAVGQHRRSAILSTMAQLTPQKGAAEMFQALQEAGLPIHALSHGAVSATANLFDQAQMRHFLTGIHSVEPAKAFKPRGEVYRAALAEIGVEPQDAMMVAAHAWDCHGAKAVGMRTAFVSRGHPVPASMATPDIVVEDLTDLPAAILSE